MSDSKLEKEVKLSSGNSCKLIRIRNDLIPKYYLLAFPKHQCEPNYTEITEMLNLGTEYARKLVLAFIDDSEAFTI